MDLLVTFSLVPETWRFMTGMKKKQVRDHFNKELQLTHVFGKSTRNYFALAADILCCCVH